MWSARRRARRRAAVHADGRARRPDARGEHHDDVWEILGVEQPAGDVDDGRLVPRRAAVPRAAARGGRAASCACGQHAGVRRGRPARARRRRRLVGELGRAKPAPEFFARVVELAGAAPERIAYVGDRVDNDVGPALAAGHGRRAHPPRAVGASCRSRRAAAIRIRSLDELPAVLP